MDQKLNIYLNALNRIPCLGPKRIFYLMGKFRNNAEMIWHASFNELKLSRLKSHLLEEIIKIRPTINPLAEWEKLQKLNIEVLAHPKLKNAPSLYPTLLAQIPVPPPILYIKGTIEEKKYPTRIALVGSRALTPYGKRATEEIAYILAKNSVVITSGLALGIDTIAHKAALKAEMPTIAVLANGLDSIYPKMNTNIVHSILHYKGALISEFPLETEPLKRHFPQRNRIISGLAQATLITEATLKSGSLITASHALEQNRDIFAVPGSIFSKQSAGTNNLIKQGAKLVTCADDVLEELIPLCLISVTFPIQLMG